MFTKKIFYLIVISDEDLHDYDSSELHVTSDNDGEESKYFASFCYSHVVNCQRGR